jgi:hypothetical protein
MSKERDGEFRPAVEAKHALLMISPTPGIRRPSYNGAPAMPTSAHFQTAKAIILRVPDSPLNSLNDFLPLYVSPHPRPNACGRVSPHRSRRRRNKDEGGTMNDEVKINSLVFSIRH